VPANPRITLIITTYNWPAALDLTLRSVARQSMQPDEIIVADDGTRLQNAYDFWCAAIRRSCPTISADASADQRGSSRSS
jgi:GT2 family glycosyltransferase